MLHSPSNSAQPVLSFMNPLPDHLKNNCFLMLQYPYTYEETPLNLSECKAETSNDYSKKRTILKLKTENGPDYLLQTESEFSMQSWLQIIDDITANNSRQLRWARRSITSRTRSPTSQSPVNKMRKASAGSCLKPKTFGVPRRGGRDLVGLGSLTPWNWYC